MWGRGGGIAPAFLTPTLDGGEWSASHPGRFTPRERTTGTHRIGGWVEKRKIPAPTGNRTLAVQPVAISRELYRGLYIMKM
jgi:hypothetical protein